MRCTRILSSAFVLSFVCCSVFAKDTEKLPAAAQEKVNFVEDVQPLLQARCHSCHGSEAQEAGLRLDRRKDAFLGGDSGKAIIVGNSAESRLIHLVAGTDEDTGLMPPEDEGTPLSDRQIAMLRGWIDQGADWPESADSVAKNETHWSFQPLVQPEVPSVGNREWVRNPIDNFILANLEAKAVQPSSVASRETLIRRLYLDLTGLPPTPEDVHRFLTDRSTDAYERLVDRVLESKHYGERWARHWLDLARYADSDGYEKDRQRPFAWRYRQWVIEALNADMPFDQFTVEQIAGDMLPDATLNERIATGFHRNTLHNTEGGTDREEDRVKKTVDRTNTIGAIWLGLTVGCAQCHSHKYDPLPQREYYSLYGFLNSINETDITAPLAAEKAKFEQQEKIFEEEHARLQAAIDTYLKERLPSAQAAWEARASRQSTVWSVADITAMSSKNGASLKQQSDKSILATGKNELSDVYSLTLRSELPTITAIRLEVLPDKSLVKSGPGRANNGNFVLTTFRASAGPIDGDSKHNPVVFETASADFSQIDWHVAKAINNDPKDGWAISPQFGKRHVAVFVFEKPIEFEKGAVLDVVMDQTYSRTDPHNIGRFRLSVTDCSSAIQLDGPPSDVANALKVKSTDRTPGQRDVIRKYYETIDVELTRLKSRLSEHSTAKPKAAFAKAQAVSEASTRRETRVHLRGDFLNKGDKVDVNTPSVLPAIKPRGDTADRLDLAYWLVDSSNPMTARVTVNRLWQRYFGRGIVGTVDDFGSQGDLPTHPQLLDWLACEFRDSGWRLKHIHRLIVNSATYRQTSAARDDLRTVDPNNQWLARQSRHRVEAEVVRDLTLAASGLLSRKIGGPSVRPPQPEEYSSLTYANSAKWKTSTGEDRYRRGLYTFFQRTSPYPMLMTFDSPDSTLCTAQRARSNTPLQALTLLNDVAFFECAQALGRRIVSEVSPRDDAAETVAARVVHAFLICLARQPDDDELDAVVDLFNAQRRILENNRDAVDSIVGSAASPAGVDGVELAAWMITGRVLLNLDEFITRE